MAEASMKRGQNALAAAFLIALTATLGALFIGEVLRQMPCTLCWYQRIAMFPLVVIFGVGLWLDDLSARLTAWPLASAGAAMALWHSSLYAGVIPQAVVPCAQKGPSCTDAAAQTVLGLPLPYVSFVAFAAIIALLTLMKGHRT